MALLALMLLTGCYEALDDTAAGPPDNRLSGTVVVDATEVTGLVAIIAYDATDPPPPVGTGGPVALATVSPESFTGSSASIQSAPWTMTGLGDGTYLIGALYDVDGDFSPILPILAGGTCGDLAGGHPADLAGTTGVVTVEGGEWVDDVALAVTTEYTIERPAFTLGEATVSAASNDGFELASVAIDNDFIEITGPYDGTDPCDAAFYIYLPDNDGDGYIDPHPDFGGAEGAYDIWPRIYLTYQGDGDVAVEAGEQYYTQALIDPTAWVMDGTMPYPPTAPYAFLTTDIDAVWPGQVVHEDADGNTDVLAAGDIPTGTWKVTVVSYSGQTWSVPNSLALYGSTEDATTQGVALVVQ